MNTKTGDMVSGSVPAFIKYVKGSELIVVQDCRSGDGSLFYKDTTKENEYK